MAIGLFLFCRKRRSTQRISVEAGEEAIPLSQDFGDSGLNLFGKDTDQKGKRKADAEPVFDVGSDEGYHDQDDSRND